MISQSVIGKVRIISNTNQEENYQMTATAMTVTTTIEAISCTDCRKELRDIEELSFCAVCHVYVCMHSDCPCPLTPQEEAELACCN